MEFRILGPLEVRDGGRPLALGHGRSRTLLAVLLLRANEIVSSERLIDDLWGAAPPRSATKALQGHVSQLRRTLPGLPLETHPPGYVLWADPDALDALRFAKLVREGRRALAAGAARDAAAILHAALALWRGPALPEFAFDAFAASECARLADLRLAALEDRIEADLALGRHEHVVGELEALVADHPLRERPRGQLMLALYRSGRQAEALQQYRAAREALAGEPSEPLRRLERAILANDARLAAPAAEED